MNHVNRICQCKFLAVINIHLSSKFLVSNGGAFFFWNVMLVIGITTAGTMSTKLFTDPSPRVIHIFGALHGMVSSSLYGIARALVSILQFATNFNSNVSQCEINSLQGHCAAHRHLEESGRPT